MEGTRALRWARVDWGPFWERECCGFLGREKSWSETTILRAETKLDSRPGGTSKAQRPPGGARMWFSEEEGQRVFTVRQPWLCPRDCRPALGPVLDSAANIALQRVASRPHI